MYRRYPTAPVTLVLLAAMLLCGIGLLTGYVPREVLGL